jgi:hypothetical protein
LVQIVNSAWKLNFPYFAALAGIEALNTISMGYIQEIRVKYCPVNLDRRKQFATRYYSTGLVENYGVEQSLSLLDLTTQKTGCPRLNVPLAV